MIYIVVALYIEAKILIEKYNLKKDKNSQKFQIFYNDKIKLIITGIGRVKSAIALTYLLENNEKNREKENDFVINLGFCASAYNKSNLLDIVMISKIKSAYSKQSYYPDMLYKHHFLEGTLICYDEVIENFYKSERIYIDMESIGFYEAASQYFKKDRIIILKMVSDILDSEKDKRKIINYDDSYLLLKVYEEIFDFLNKLKEFSITNNSVFSENQKKLIEKIRQNLKLSDTMYYEFINLMKYLKLSGVNVSKFLNKYEEIEINNKLEGKKYFEEIKKRVIDE